MYKDYELAIKAIKKDVIKVVTEPSVIFECVIPKGSHYYESATTIDSIPSIASNKLKIIKQL